MKPLTLFSWGYWGWGNATSQLVQMVNAVEASRGYGVPLFVDIRYSRTVRAVGFRGNAFEQVAGKANYRWLQPLGNRAIANQSGPRVQIADPQAVNELLDLAIDLASHERRLLFYCACEFSMLQGEINCHRCEVADLLLNAAKQRGISAEVMEWPGGCPADIELQVDAKVVQNVLRRKKHLLLDGLLTVAQIGGLAGASRLFLSSEQGAVATLIGPAKYQDGYIVPIWGYWTLPLDAHDDPPNFPILSEDVRKQLGLQTRSSLT